jgi:hypothetical protein
MIGISELCLAGAYDEHPMFLALAATLREYNWQPPVDPDLVEARKVAADTCASLGGNEGYVEHMRRGSYDCDREVQTALAAIKRGRELERGA